MKSVDVLKEPQLALHCEKVFPQAVRPHLFVCCPTRDLIAVVTEEEHLEVYRFGEHRAFGLKRKQTNLKVDCIQWNENGESLLVSWSDGSIDQVYSDPRQHRSITAAGVHPLTCLGWSTTYVDPVPKAKGTDPGGDDVTQFSSGIPGLGQRDDQSFTNGNHSTAANLPEMLGSLGAEDELPKLSAIPLCASVAEHDRTQGFTSQGYVDVAFHRSSRRQQLPIDVIIACQDSGLITRKVHGFMDLCPLQHPMHSVYPRYRVVAHASHPLSSTHELVTAVPAMVMSSSRSPRGPTPALLALVPLDLRLTSSSGSSLSHDLEAIEQWCVSLKDYIVRAVFSMRAALQQARDLPARFIQFVRGNLAESDQGNLVHLFYHLAVTGHCPPELKGWLADGVGVRGHQRWDQAVTSGLSDIVMITHENLLPALERCSVIANRFDGLSKHRRAGVISEEHRLDNILLTLDSMRLIGHTVLVFATEEKRQFAVFSGWLRDQIDQQRDSGEYSESGDAAEKAAVIDYEQLLAYIEGPMLHSKLEELLGDFASTDLEPLLQQKIIDMNALHELCIRALASQKKSLKYEQSHCSLPMYLWLLEWQLNAFRADISNRLGDNATFGSNVILESAEMSVVDVRVVLESTENHPPVRTYVAAVARGAASQVNIYAVSRDVTSSTKCEKIFVPLGKGEIKDLKFADDFEIIVMFRRDDVTELLSLMYRKGGPTGDKDVIANWEPSGPSVLSARVKHTFHHRNRFMPQTIAVNGRKGRRVICVLGQDLRHYKVFDLDPLEESSAKYPGTEATLAMAVENEAEPSEEGTVEDPNEIEYYVETGERPIYDEGDEEHWAC